MDVDIYYSDDWVFVKADDGDRVIYSDHSIGPVDLCGILRSLHCDTMVENVSEEEMDKIIHSSEM